MSQEDLDPYYFYQSSYLNYLRDILSRPHSHYLIYFWPPDGWTLPELWRERGWRTAPIGSGSTAYRTGARVVPTSDTTAELHCHSALPVVPGDELRMWANFTGFWDNSLGWPEYIYIPKLTYTLTVVGPMNINRRTSLRVSFGEPAKSPLEPPYANWFERIGDWKAPLGEVS